MNFYQQAKEADLVCTCSNLYGQEIQVSIDLGCEDAEEVIFDHATQFRCGVCRPIIETMVSRADIQ